MTPNDRIVAMKALRAKRHTFAQSIDKKAYDAFWSATNARYSR